MYIICVYIHVMYITFQCRSLHSLNESLICAFVNDTTDCKPVSGFFDYTYFTYCTLSILPLAVIILVGINTIIHILRWYPGLVAIM